MKKIFSFFLFSNRIPAGRGYPLILAGTVCILLLSMLLLGFLPRPFHPENPALNTLLHQLPLALICPMFLITGLKLLNPTLSLCQLLDLRALTRGRLRKIVFRNLLLLLLLFPVIQLLILLSVHTLHLLGYEHLPQQTFFSEIYIHSWSYCLILLLCTVILAPVGEELLFRHLLCNAMLRHLPLPLPQILTSAAFALFHGIPQATPSLFLLAMLLQKRKEEDGLAAAILFHASYNLLIFIILFLRIRFLKTGAS